MEQEILELKNLLSKEECEALIKKYDLELQKLKVVGQTESVESKGRIANGTWIKTEEDKVIQKLKNIVSSITGLPIENQEAPHFIKYDVGGEYKHHFDYFNPNAESSKSHLVRGGQRVFSSILYLNEDFEGGETDFPKYELRVKPTIGTLFNWRNLKVNGELNEKSNHAGLPVISGTKYIIVIWTREGVFDQKKPQIPPYTLSHDKEKFEEFGYSFLKGIIDQKTCEEFAKELFYLKFSNKLTAENRGQLAAANSDPSVFKPSYGLGSIKRFDDYLRLISKDLSEKIGVKWKDKHTYARIYYNGGLLGKHVDRPGLDYTLSVNLFSTLKKEWPLYCIDKKGNEIAANTNVGEGILILGTKMQHWRQPLICEPNECVVQLFMHWSLPD
jgi:prolyl 4-hydroxylase